MPPTAAKGSGSVDDNKILNHINVISEVITKYTMLNFNTLVLSQYFGLIKKKQITALKSMGRNIIICL